MRAPYDAQKRDKKVLCNSTVIPKLIHPVIPSCALGVHNPVYATWLWPFIE